MHKCFWPDASSDAGWWLRPFIARCPTRCLWTSLQLTQPNNCYHGHTAAPSPSSVPAIPEASVLPSLCRLGRWPHLSQLTLHQPHGGPPPNPSHGSGPGRYVDGTPPGCPIPGRAPTLQRPAPTADRFWLLPFLALIPAVGRLLPGHQRDHIIFISPVLRGSSPFLCRNGAASWCA